MGEVVEFQIKPKRLTRQYRRQKYTVTYTPATKRWKWEVEIVQTTRFGGDADSQTKAYKAAEKHIDGVLKMQGRDVG